MAGTPVNSLNISTEGVTYFNGPDFQSITNGTVGQVLTANAIGAPTFQANPADGIVTINVDPGLGSVTGNTIDLVAADSSNLNGSTVFFNSAAGTKIKLSLSDTSGMIIGNSSGTVSYGTGNTILGPQAFQLANTGAGQNTAIGQQVLQNIQSGTYNLVAGYHAGISYTTSENGNILLNSNGIIGDISTLRIGSATGTGVQQLNKAFISGINGVTSSNPMMVTINSATDQLGVAAIPSGGIVTINGDTGSATGATVTIEAGVSTLNCGATVEFTNTGAISTLKVSDNSANTSIGEGAGAGGQNGCVSLGKSAGTGASAGDCVSIGFSAGPGVLTNSVSIGTGAGSTGTGQWNLALGRQASSNYTGTESSCINLNSFGVLGDNNTLRIGSATGTGTKELNKAFISGINGITVTGVPVLVSSSDQLGVSSSSIKFKEAVHDMIDTSSIINSLRPVNFKWKKDVFGHKEDYTDETQFGLISEEVDEAFPYLCVYDKEGKPFSVKYDQLPTILLKQIQLQEKMIYDLKQRIENLEKSIS